MKRNMFSAALGLLLLPTIARASVPECTPANESALRAEVGRLVSGLKIAQYRADMALLQDNYADIEALLGEAGSCPDAMVTRLCDAECYYQRANVHLFRATGLPLLSARGGSSPNDPLTSHAELLSQARQGLTLVEQGMARLPRQVSSGTGEEQRNLAFNRYLKAMAQLQGLKAKLLVAAGDVWYREASATRLDHLHYLVGEALGDAPLADGAEGSEYYKAATYYDQAFWLVLEARSSVPAGDLFTAELSTLATLEKDITLRLDSVRKGYLYINVDPEEFPLASIDALGQQLRSQQTALEQHEASIQALLEAWTQKYKSLQDQKFDMANLKSTRAIDLEAHKIAQLQDMADQLKNRVQVQLNGINGTLSKFEIEQRIRVLEADLKRETNDLDNQIRVVQGQREQDLLAIDQDATRDQMGEIQFNIDLTLADFNFEMQQDSLELQIDEFQNRINADDREIEIVGSRKAQVAQQIALEQKRIEASEIITNRFRAAQKTVFVSARVPVVNQICAVDAELAFYKKSAQTFSDPVSGVSCASPPSIEEVNEELIEKICDARAELSNKSREEIQKIRACIDGSGTTCSASEKNIKDLANELYEQNTKIFNSQKAMWEASVDKIKERLTVLEEVTKSHNGLDTMKTAALVAEAAAELLAAIPDGDTGAIGLFPVKLFRFGEAAAAAAKMAADWLAKIYEWKFADLQFSTQIEQERSDLNVRVKELQAEIEALDLHQAYEELVKKRSLAEIAVQLAELHRDEVTIDEEKKLQSLQCTQERGQVASTIAKLQADRAALVADLATKSDEAALVAFDIDEQENLREQAHIEIQRLTLSLGELDVEASKLRQDKQNLLAMRASVEQQLGRLGAYRARVHDLQARYDAKREVLNDIREKLRQHVINLSAGQAAFLESVIQDERTAVFAQIADLREQIRLVEQANGLEGELLAIEGKLSQEVLARRARILSLVEAAPQHDAEAIFWDFENMQAELTRGAAEFLDAKRRVVENVNFTYNLYRNRYNMLSDFAGDVAPLSPDKTFIGTATDLEHALGDCGTAGLSEVCRPSSLAWTTQTMTGSVAEFTLEKASGLVSELLYNRTVRFEISPSAVSKEDSRNLGNFVLWDEMTMNASQPMRLLHIVAGVSSSSCRSQEITVRHLGSGTVFSRLSKDNPEIVSNLVVKRPTSGLLPVYDGTEAELVNDEYARFRRGTYTARDLEMRLHDLAAASYPFVGYPLIGTYELSIDENMAGCMADGGPSLKLGFVFVRKHAR